MNIMNIKKNYTIVLIIAMVVLLTWLMWRVFLFSPTPPKPQDTELEFWILENVEGVDWADHDTPYEMYGGKAYLGENYSLELMDEDIQIPKEHIIYIITAWPDHSDSSAYVTEIEITDPAISVYGLTVATVYKGNIIKNLIMDCQSYTKYRPNETTGGIFVSWRRKEELPTGA